MTLNFDNLELKWLEFLKRNKNNPERWNTHDCPNAVVVVSGDHAVKFSGSVSRLVIICATLIVLGLTALLAVLIYVVVDLPFAVCITIIILFKMALNALGLPGSGEITTNNSNSMHIESRIIGLDNDDVEEFEEVDRSIVGQEGNVQKDD